MKIIAECGSNWKTLDDCLMSIEKAHEAGAHAVKFQYFFDRDLYGPQASLCNSGTTPYLSDLWIHSLKHHCDKHEIEFMCTAFHEIAYTWIDQFVFTHKIASAEMTDTTILRKVNSFGKPVYLSTAGSSIDEVGSALEYLRNCPVTIMFCVGDYPAKIIDFRKLTAMREVFGPNFSYGYSDHSLDVLNIPMKSKELGASVIEKHVNFTTHKDTADAGHAINFDEFKLMTRQLMGEAISMEEVEDHCNKDMKKFYKRRFIAIKDISQGEEFLFGKNFGIYRATKAQDNHVLTFRQWDLDNKKSLNNISVGNVISYGDIESEVL